MRRMPSLSMATSVPPAHGHAEIGGGQRRHSFGASMPPSQHAAVPTRIWRPAMGPSRPCPPVHPAQARGSRWHARSLRPVDARCSMAGVMATTLGLPSVSVPVLSTGERVARFSRSRASAFLISTPDCVPRPTATMMDIGVARPSAQAAHREASREELLRDPIACCVEHAIVSGNATEQKRKIAVLSRATLAKPGPAGTNCRQYR